MYRRNLRRIFGASLALCCLLGALSLGGSAAGDIFVNGSADVLPGGIGSAYAIAGDGSTAQLGLDEVYVMTGSGLSTLQGGGEAAETPTGAPGHLSVTGSIDLPYDKVRVGLYYYDSESSLRNPTLEYANLENEVGSGYALGYYDSAREFHALGYTDERAITMAMDRNVETGGGHVGCYHILLPGTYDSFDAAQAACAQYGDGFPAYYNGVFRALVGDYDSAAAAASDAAARGIQGEAFSASAYCVVVTRTSDAKILFEFDCGSGRSLGVQPRSGGEKTETWFKGYTYNGGFEYSRRTGGKLTVVNVVDIEDYVKGVITYEMSADWPLEALKAQAIASHSYALYQRDHADADKLSGAWFSADPARRQGYMTREVLESYWGSAFEENWARLESLFTPILHQVLTYEGAPAAACYHAISNGQTEASENVWNEALPYLSGVDSTLDLTAEGYEQTVTYTTQQMYDAIVLAVPGAQPEQGKPESWFGEASTTAAGYVDTIECAGVFIRGTDLRTALGLRSACFSIEYSDGVFAVTTRGYGHGVGMSQYGASAMALTGKSCAEILAHYYPGTALETLG